MNPAYPAGHFFKDKMTPVSVERTIRKRDKQTALDTAYAEVNRRDQNICQCTGARLDPHSRDSKHLREHHHLKGRNVKPEWREDPNRIVLVSKAVHDLITTGWIVVEGTDARKVIKFHWAEHVPVEKRTVVIRSKRRSQRRESA